MIVDKHWHLQLEMPKFRLKFGLQIILLQKSFLHGKNKTETADRWLQTICKVKTKGTL